MFDVLTMAALTDEFASRLVGGRIQRVVQVGEATLGLEVYAERQRLVLIAGAEPRNPRLYLATARVSADPDRVTPLLLLLRKYARGGQIVAVQQPPLERILRLSIAKRFWAHKPEAAPDEPDQESDEGEIVYTHLVVELMGRRSNIVLIDDEGRIMDAARRVTPEMSRVRPILPGRSYEAPPAQDKTDPRRLDASTLGALLASAAPTTPVATFLVQSLAGFSPQMAREAAYRALGRHDLTVADLDDESAADTLAGGVAAVLAPLTSQAWEPAVYLADGRAVAFSPIRLEHLAEATEERLPSISAAIERYLALAGEAAPVKQAQRREALVARIRAARERVAARLHSLREEQQRAEAGERWRTMGELIYTALYDITPGQTEVTVDGVTIPLDPALSPSDNAQAYFERYRKAQSATANLPELLAATETELGYLQQLETLAGFAESVEEVEQLQHELDTYTTERRGDAATGKRKRAPRPRRPESYRTPRGDLIYVGRNGRQNETVTFELAGPDDAWLHARGLPGAHVVIHWAGPEDDATVAQAARLAAYYSTGQGATTVEVDVTQRRYVKKIKGAGPGMVTYRNERTLRVRPASPRELGLTD